MSRARHPEITKATEGTNKNSRLPARAAGSQSSVTPRASSRQHTTARSPSSRLRKNREGRLFVRRGCGGPRRRLAFAKLRRAVPVPTRGSSRASQSPGGLGEEASRAAPRRLLRRPVAANGAYGSPSPDGWGGQEGAARCCLARPSTHRPTPRGTPLRAAACREAA